MLGRDYVSEVLEKAVKALEREGLEGEAEVGFSEEQTVRSAWGEIHQAPLARSFEITLVGRKGKRDAAVSLAIPNASSLRAGAKRVKELVVLAPENPYLPDLNSQPETLPELSLPELDQETLGHAWQEKAEALRNAQRAASLIDCVASGRFFTGLAEKGVANSRGLLRYQALTGAQFSLVVTGPNHLSSLAKHFHTAIGGVSREAVIEEAIARASLAKSLPFLDPFDGDETVRSFDVVLHPYALAIWIEWLAACEFNGLMVHEKQSCLSDKIGELITGKNITIRDDWKYEGFPAMPFDGEGTTRREILFIEKGYARGAAYDGETAKKARVSPTGHDLIPQHIIFEGGDKSEKGLIENCDRPTVYATYFNYAGMPDSREGIFTATTRHGTFLIEDGKFMHVLPPLRFKEKTMDAFKRVKGLSSPVPLVAEENYDDFWPQSIAAPFAKIGDCAFIGSNKYA